MNSILNWIGGKRLLRKQIVPMIPRDIESYIEPFGGAAWILFASDRWAPLEIYNDLDGRLVNLFRCIKYHPSEFSNEYKFMVSSRELFKQYRDQQGLTDIQKAARFLYLIKRSFGAKGGTFGTGKRSGGAGPVSHEGILDLGARIHHRLDKVILENLHYEEVMRRYDREGAFFYCDPPYIHGYRYPHVDKMDHEKLAMILGGGLGAGFCCPSTIAKRRDSFSASGA